MLRRVRGINTKLKLSSLLINDKLVINEFLTTKAHLKQLHDAIDSLQKDRLFSDTEEYLISFGDYKQLIEYLQKGDTNNSLKLLQEII